MMPKEFEANTLEEAYEKASLEFECSIVDLQIDIIQTPSSGFLGFFKKTAVIKAKIIKKIKNIINIINQTINKKS